MTQEQSVFSKYARHFFSGTLLSRISGMIRDISMAAIFGDHPSVAAFMVAFRFSHFLRRFFGEGTLQSIFIPHYEELRLNNECKANGFFFQLYALLSIFLVLIVLIVELAISFNCFSQSSSKEVFHLFAWMFPSLIFICLYGLNVSLLQCRNSFLLSSIPPFACNLIWIFAIFIFANRSVSTAMTNLSRFITLGFFVQWLMTLPKIWKILLEGKRNFIYPERGIASIFFYSTRSPGNRKSNTFWTYRSRCCANQQFFRYVVCSPCGLKRSRLSLVCYSS